MRAVEFEQQTNVFGKDQDEYLNLPAQVVEGKEGQVITCWEMTDEEFEVVKKTKRVYLGQLTFKNPLQPLRQQLQ